MKISLITHGARGGHRGGIEQYSLNLIEALLKAKELGMSRIFIESGITLAREFFKKKLIDDFVLFVSNKKLGNDGNGNIKKIINKFISKEKKINNKINLFEDKLITYNLK